MQFGKIIRKRMVQRWRWSNINTTRRAAYVVKKSIYYDIILVVL